MPITTIAVPYGQHVVGATRLLLPVLDQHGQPIVVIDNKVGISYPFQVVDQPMTLVATKFNDHDSDYVQVQVSPDGVTWQDLWLHGTPIQLTRYNSMVHISIPGIFRLTRYGWGEVGTITPSVYWTSTISGWYGTLTHEPALGMIPEVGPLGPQGPMGETGQKGDKGDPTTALFIISPTAPGGAAGVGYDAGSAWWDSDNGRAFILFDDGTSRQWVEFVGAPSVANFIISPTAPPIYGYEPGAAWWDSDNGRTFILFDDGTSRQWVEFIGSIPMPALVRNLTQRIAALEAKLL